MESKEGNTDHDDIMKEIERIKKKVGLSLLTKVKQDLEPSAQDTQTTPPQEEEDKANLNKEIQDILSEEKIPNNIDDILENIPSQIVSQRENDTPITLNELQSDLQTNHQFIGTFNPMKQEQIESRPAKEESPSPLQTTQSNQNNVSQISVTSMHKNFQSQLKKIEETNETSKIEEEQNMQLIREMEKDLSIDQRLTHENREIRKNACKEITEMCQNEFDNDEDKKEFFEAFSPWVKFCIEETNAYVLPEALNYFITFNTIFPEQNSNSIKDFFDNIERIASFGISAINELCKRIIFLFVKDKKLFNMIQSELLKCLNNGSLKLIKFINDIYSEMINKNVLSENYIKLIFEKSIHIYNSNKGNVKNNEKRKNYGKLITFIYQIIDDDTNTIKHFVHMTSQKEFDSLLSKVKKANTKFRLYPKFDGEQSERISTVNNNSDSNLNSSSIAQTKGNVEKEKNYGIVPEEVNDLSSVFPNDFFEYVFMTQFQEKLSVLEEVNKILPKIKTIRDKDNKNFTDIYKTIHLSIEDSNILIHLEGIKILGHIARLLMSDINMQKLKLILETCFDKFKDKKSLVKNELFNLFDAIIENECLPCEMLILFMLQFCQNQQKVTAVVKQSIIEYIKILFKTSKSKIKKLLSKIADKNYFQFTKSIVDIIGKESLSTVKDLCSDLLIIIKGKVNDIDEFNELIQPLPNYRKKLIEQNNENGNNVQSESNYKKNLRRIKSNLSFVRSRSISKNEKSNQSNSRLNTSKLNTSYRNESSTSTPKTNKIKSQNILKRVNSSKQNIKVVKKKEQPKEKKKVEKENEIDIKPSQNENKKETLEQKKDDVLNNISNQDEKSLETYSKNLVRDFLYFVNKVSEGELNEDLSCHFKIIFSVLQKILERLTFLFSQNSSSQSIPNKNQLLDTVIVRMIKVLILVPCIPQINGSSKLDDGLFESFTETIKAHSRSKEKFYIHLLFHLVKFANKGKGCFEKVDPKLSIVYFLRYIKEGNAEIKSEEITNTVNAFLNETHFLSDEEKEEFYYKEVNDESSDKSITQNMDDIEPPKEEPEPNLGINSQNVSKIEHVEQPSHIIIEPEKKEEDDYLAKKIKESQLLINQKEIENKKLRDKIQKLYQQKKESTSMNNSIEQSQNKINIVNSSPLNISSIKGDKGDLNKIIEENKERIINNLKSATTGEKGSDILKIKEQLNLTTKKLGIALQRMVQQTESKEKGISERLNSIKSESTQSPIKETEIKLNPNFIMEQSEIHSTISKNSNLNTLTDFFQPSQPNLPIYKIQINSLIQVLDNKIVDVDIFSNLILSYKKLTSPESKMDYIKYLRCSLDNPLLISRISINIFLQLYEYLLTILSSEILYNPKEEAIIAYLQEIAEHLKKNRNLSDMFKLMLFLLRKNFPQSLSIKITDISLVMIKILTYLIKELIKVLVTVKEANITDILGEINDLFVSTPPSSLTNLTPNAMLYQRVFTVLKCLTDELVNIYKINMKEVIEYLEKSKIVCKEYIEYIRKKI